MAAFFLLALLLIGWQALRTKPVRQPDFEIATEAGERLSPVAVASWRPPLDLPAELPRRLAVIEQHALAWPAAAAAPGDGLACAVSLRISSQHWALRRASAAQVERWRGQPGATGPAAPWRRLYLPVESFLDDDDGDGDPLDAGELREAGPGAEVEAFCGKAAATTASRGLP